MGFRGGGGRGSGGRGGRGGGGRGGGGRGGGGRGGGGRGGGGRGGGGRGGGGRGGRFGKKRGQYSNVSQAQKHHFRQFGELHPAESGEYVKKYTKVEDKDPRFVVKPAPVHESSSESEEETSYQQLISSIGQTTGDDFQSSGEEEDVDDDTQSNDDDLKDDGDDDIQSNDEHLPDNDESDENDIRSDDDHENDVRSDDDDDVGGDDDVESHLSDSELSEHSATDEDKITLKTKTSKRKRKMSVSSSDGDVEQEEITLKESDPFSIHFEKELTDDTAEELSAKTTWEKKEITVSGIGKAFLQWMKPDLLSNDDKTEKHLEKLHVKERLCAQVRETNRTLCHMEESQGELSPLQLAMFKVLNSYKDVQFPCRDLMNAEELRLVYCLHILNHVLKTRSRIIAHNAKLKTKRKNSVDVEYRDQGLTRPKVLIVLPFRQSALKVVELLMDLIKDNDKIIVGSKKRFKSEYGAENDEDFRKGLKPEDYEATFSGNNDDHFRIGISVSKKSLKLYSPFYMSDIILASPLGLRTVIGAEGENERDYDFLSSIEMLILDQADIFLMQNWDHILHAFKHFHLQPKEAHNVDFSRVRMWTLNGWSKFYRQTIILNSVMCPEINAIFNKHCHNFAGKLQFIRKPTNGAICQIIAQLPQIFHRLECCSYNDLSDTKFNFFIKKLLPHHKDPVMSQTFIFIPSYFDFVRLRNYFKKEEVDFVHLNEYATDRGISRARCDFYHGRTHFMLYTERLHFYRRFKIRGIKHLIFYGLPQYPHFYGELCNMIKDRKRRADCDNATCTVMYSRYDAQRLAEVVGSNRASLMISSEKHVHMFVTGEDG